MSIGPRRAGTALAAAAAAASVLVAVYVALGGGAYKPLEVADPCDPRPLAQVEGLEEVAQQVTLSALDGAACRLRVTREELALALATSESRERFAREHGIEDDQLENAIRAGLARAVRDAERTGRLSEIEASLVTAAVEGLPIETLIDVVRTGKGLAEVVGDVLRP